MGKHLQTSPSAVRAGVAHQHDKTVATRHVSSIRKNDGRFQFAKEKGLEVIASRQRSSVSVKFAFVSLAISSLFAFGIGRFARLYMLKNPQDQLQMFHTHLQACKLLALNRLGFSECLQSESCTEKSTTFASTCCITSHESKQGNKADGYNDKDSEDDDENNGDYDNYHHPAGEQLSVDIKNVDADFLRDRQILTQAMIDTVSELDLTLLSYHCHTLPSLGVGCAGVLQEGQIIFHTRPIQGVLALNLFTLESALLIPVVPIIERSFVVTKASGINSVEEQPIVVWSRKYRGSRDQWDTDSDSIPPLSERKDLGKEVSNMDSDLKQLVSSWAAVRLLVFVSTLLLD
jgi:hypothetical protein